MSSFLSILFGILFKAKEGLLDSLWYVAYIAFLTVMVYLGSDGALNVTPYYWATAIVAIISAAVFYPHWNIVWTKTEELRGSRERRPQAEGVNVFTRRLEGKM
ncbi:hypothetical protein HS1genome_1502 [Sulfodiicoccus acidiphilus]|uniref:Uncharacterized protein n=1 Tax=Sulfodiicoccus acidiphilus TaxID=1670455 RepID=A0A348B4L1_9CREN|nr:hypothetical protein [Sulfodiicoccus acidiphilus]BBD73113.1 hypothetical protein HS1genome_1502 [Sulfodiicoccus acidiphilus]GGU00698.1 hypothetical protein GCM10007116_17440 [Sulfodiicoccus acidiphilus]